MPTRVVVRMLDRKEPLLVHRAVCDVFQPQPCPIYHYCKSVSWIRGFGEALQCSAISAPRDTQEQFSSHSSSFQVSFLKKLKGRLSPNYSVFASHQCKIIGQLLLDFCLKPHFVVKYFLYGSR